MNVQQQITKAIRQRNTPIDIEKVGEVNYLLDNNQILDYGDWVLYESIYMGNVAVEPPQLGILHSMTPCDQTIEVHFMRQPRRWMDNQMIVTNPEINYQMKLSNVLVDNPMDSIAIWDWDLNILGVWKSKPTLKQLLSAMRKSVYYENYKKQR